MEYPLGNDVKRFIARSAEHEANSTEHEARSAEYGNGAWSTKCGGQSSEGGRPNVLIEVLKNPRARHEG